MRLFKLVQFVVGSALWALLAFTSLAAQAQDNLVASGTATASTADLPASNAIDGNMASRWASAAQTDPSYITLDLGQTYDLTGVTIYWEAANADTYQIRGSNDGQSWETLIEQSGGAFGDRTDQLEVSGSYRYVQMYGISRSAGNEWGYSIWELEVFGQEPAQAAPTLVQAEDYTRYYDTDAGNNGGTYRSDDVDIEATTDEGGGHNVGWTAAGEGLEYDVILAAGSYAVSARVASDTGGGDYTVSVNGQAVGGNTVGNTGGWQVWQTQSLGEVTLSSLEVYTLRVDISQGSFNLNWLNLEPIPSGTGGGGGTGSGGSTEATDITDLGGPVSSQFSDSPAGEEIERVIDNDANTKYLTFNPSVWVQYQAPEPYVVSRYTLTSANDAPFRDPQDWTLQGSNNGSDWTTLDTRTNEDFPDRFQTREFTFNNGNAFSHYRLDITNDNDAITQLAEWELFGTPGDTSNNDSGNGDTGSSFGPAPSKLSASVSSSSAINLAWSDNSTGEDGFTLERSTSGTTGFAAIANLSAGSTSYSDSGLSASTTYYYRVRAHDAGVNSDWSNTASATTSASTGGGDTGGDGSGGDSSDLGSVAPLYNSNTVLEGPVVIETADALITRFSDRARDRHAKEDHFQSYDHYLSFYWEDRSAGIEIVDYVAKGGSSVRMNVKTQFKLSDTEAENRWFYRGVGTVAEYCDNGTMVVEDQFNYHKERSHNCREARAIQVGDKLEFEISQFLDPSVPNGRANYYGTTYLYIVGEGLVPWDDNGGATPFGGVKDSRKIPESSWLGGRTTIHADTSGEPDNRFMQMPTNLGFDNAQPFLLGRRVLHTSFVDGRHDEKPVENPVLDRAVNKAGNHFINDSCTSCHERNGGAAPAPVGQHLDRWVFKVGDANGNPHPAMGRVLQAEVANGASSEGQVSIAFWSESNGLRSPNYQFTGVTPERFSARIAPRLVGMGLLEAVPEANILALEDPNDANGDGISGRAHRVVDPETGETRVGRFGWKAGKARVRHQVAGALNTDMGVMTSVFPAPDCGANQADCGPSGSELSEQDLAHLTKYMSLLGVPPQSDYDDPSVQNGENLFTNLGCAACHTPRHQTSEFHPFAELRNQTIHPYTDLLLHDMGPGLADNLAEGQASGAEWRTTPLWGLGKSACVTGGTTVAPQGEQECTPEHSYLHDGRARTIEEAILWHGGEGEDSANAYQALSSGQKQDLLNFLRSL